MAKMFLHLAKDINLHNQELSKQEKEKKRKKTEKDTAGHFVLKLLRTEKKEKNLESSKKEKCL